MSSLCGEFSGTSTRAEREAEARRLRAEGLYLREIAERMGAAISTVQAWLSDPGGAKLRARKQGYAGTCERCGAPTNGYAGPGKPARHCLACNGENQALRQREEFAGYREMVEQMWAEGMTCRQIGEALGWSEYGTLTNISQLRARGYNLPYRRSAAQVARITKGSADRMAVARAARKRAA